MKIKDILREFDTDQVNISKDVASDFQRGADKVDRMLNPKRWFGIQDKADNARVKKQLAGYEIKDALAAAVSGKVYQSDIGSLKQILANVKNGTFKVANPQSVKQSLETVINGGTLSKEQAAEITAFSKTFN